jgi:hypothetical protein
LSAGSVELGELTARATEHLPAEQQFASAGKVAELAARIATPQLSRQRPWVSVREGLAIEDWHIDAAPSDALGERNKSDTGHIDAMQSES